MAAPTTTTAALPLAEATDMQQVADDDVEAEELPVGDGSLTDRSAAAVEDMDARSDADSSSLTDLADATDEQGSPSYLAHRSSIAEDNDSEAETERLEDTPRKTFGAATGLIAFSSNVDHSPSKLANVVVAEAESPPESPITPIDEKEVPTLDDKRYGDAGITAAQQSLATISEPTSLIDTFDRKRKRSTSEDGVDDALDAEAPVRKRSGSSRVDLEVPHDLRRETAEHNEAAVEDALEHDDEELDVREEIAGETTESSSAKASLKTGKGGKRKGKNVLESTEKDPDTYDDIDRPDLEEGDQPSVEDDDDPASEEKIAERTMNLEVLSKIREQFYVFRDKEMNEQLESYNSQIAALEAPEPSHLEFLNMLRCLDDRRDERIAQENTRREYKVACLKKQTIAQRHQVQSQYFQAVREHRDKAIENCQKRLIQINRERRRHGHEENDFSTLYKPSRIQQIRYQTAYNKEVSILAGVAKYRGFPAAPDILAATQTDIEHDLKRMEITPRVTGIPANVAAPYSQAMRAEHAAAEEQFLEKTPWANPLHPSHQTQYALASAQSRNITNPLTTPAAQKHTVDLTAPNGSASTIDAVSNPPSSAAAPGTGNSQRARHSKTDDSSPLLPMKRPNPRPEAAHPSPAISQNGPDAPSPAPQQWKRQKEADHPFSSPMQSKMASAAASALSAGGPSRNRTPMGSRNVAVNASGGASFGR